MLGQNFEHEIREQPGVWRGIASSDRAERLAHAIRGRDVVLIGSGSSLYMAQLGALAFRRRGIRAHALAATEAPLDNVAYRNAVVIACSQSGRSRDLLAALEILSPRELIAVTNTPQSALAERAQITIDLGAGIERAVPASKSVTATAAIFLWAAGQLAASAHGRSAQTLLETADMVQAWLDSPNVDDVRMAAQRLALRRSIVVAGTGYGTPVAGEFALKIKEASYIHAEGFSAGEFRHGSAAMLDPGCAIVGIVDDASREIVARPMTEAKGAESARYVVGGSLADIPVLGPLTGDAFNPLAWLITGQLLALFAGRARGIESDAPRGLSKAIT